MAEHTELKKSLISYEGNISHMYLDTRANVTVGVGHLLATTAAAQALPFRDRESGDPAEAEWVTAEFNRIKALKPGLIASYYRSFTTLELTREDIDALLDEDIAEVVDGVSNHFTGFAAYPTSPADAILDMAFNLGMTKLIKQYPKLHAAALRGDWAACAAECHRRGIPDERNELTRALFLQQV